MIAGELVKAGSLIDLELPTVNMLIGSGKAIIAPEPEPQPESAVKPARTRIKPAPSSED